MLFSVLISTSFVVASAKFFGSHEFPLLTPRGEQTANEFQMVFPEHIRFKKVEAAMYNFDSISPLLIDNDDVVTVQFSSQSPYSSDWIGAYSPANVDITKTVPVKYGWCDDDTNYLSSGKGTMTFNFTNLRADIAFYYFTNYTYHPINVGKAADTVTFRNFNEQLRPRVVPTGDPDVFKLLWSSASSRVPVMLWGTSPGEYAHKLLAKTSHIDMSEMCGAPASTVGWRDLGLIHTVEMKGMVALANQKIYYKFGDHSSGDFSKEYTFYVPPIAGTQPPTRPTTVILYDDMGRGTSDSSYTWNEYGRPSYNTSQSVAAEIASGGIDAIYHGGDISYATGYTAVWDFYLDMIAPMASSVIYLTTVGNHESDWPNSASFYNVSDSGGECGVLTTKLIPMPAPATTNEPWWSYDVGLIHFIGISSEHDYSIGSKQYLWLENDLASVDRKVTPWVIFGAHRAMYLNSNYGGGVTSDLSVMDWMIQNLEPLLFKYRVNLGFYGHNHVVQRHSAVYNKTVVQASTIVFDENGNEVHHHEDPQATVHLVIGTAGAAFTVNAVTPPPDWNELFYYRWGYSKLVATNSTHLYWEWIESSSNEVVDRMSISQSDPSVPWKL